jgi:hypothetical protein
VPEEFFDVVEFRGRIEPNGKLNQAIRALRARKPDPGAALAELRAIGHLAQGHVFTANPLYLDVCERLAAIDGALDVETRFELQERINELNTIGHVFTRTRKREVSEHFPTRRAVVVKVQLTQRERDFYDAVTEFVRSQAGTFTNFVAVMPQRQVASSIPAAREYLRERWGMSATVESDTVEDLDVDVDADDALDPLDDDAWSQFVDAWRGADGVDSKYAAFVAEVRKLIESGMAKDGKILVFSFFRKTIEHLEAGLRSELVDGTPLRVSRLYGPTPEEERHRIAAAFREEPGPHVVLASEIAAEGLDFEFANTMINYDLPWNPMRVEQRIGRLDRYGQESRVITIVNFSVEDTIEERILDRLYTRIGIFEEAIGDLESILGDEIQTLTRELLRPDLSVEEEKAILDQVAENILRRRNDAERFEKDSQALLGQDDVFTDQLGRIERDQRFVGPDEIRNFVTVALKTRYPRIQLSPGDGTLGIQVPKDGELRDLLYRYLDKRPERGGRKARQSAGRAAPGTEWIVATDPQVAKRRRDLDFLALQHPLVGALLDEEPDVTRSTTALLMPAGTAPPGRYLFFLYLLDIRGVRPGLEFLPVVVAEDGAVDPSLSDSLMKLIGQSERSQSSGWRPDEPVVDRAFDAAEVWVSVRVRDREEELSRLNNQIVDRRMSSLQESFDRWLVHRRQLLRRAQVRRQDSIARLHQGYIRKREAELAEKLRQLDGQRLIQIGQDLVAGGLLQVEGKPT